MLARFPEPGRLAAAIDILDGHLVVHGFTTPAAITASEALDTVTQAAAGRCAVLYTDVAAVARAPAGASIAAGTSVSLCDALTSIDLRNLEFLIAAMRHAAGQRQPS